MQRNISLDLLKILSCFLICAMHTCTVIWNNDSINITNILYYTTTIAIPLFFIINGYLILGKKLNDNKYILKKIYHIARIILLLNILLCAIYLIQGHEITISTPFIWSIKSLYIYAPYYFWQFWFLGSLVLIYFMFPLINYIYLKYNKTFIIISVILISTQILMDFFNIQKSLNNLNPLEANIPLIFRLYSWLSYFMIGGLIKKYEQRIKISLKLWTLVLLLGITLIYILTIRNIYIINHCEFYYNCPLIICLSTYIFIFTLKKQVNSQLTRIIRILSPTIMVVYIIHPYIIYQLAKYFTNPNLAIIYSFLVFFISSAIGLAATRVPIINKLLKI